MKTIDYQAYIKNHVIKCDASGRGGQIKVDVSELFPNIEGATIGAYQNYLEGGMLGAIIGTAMFEPEELNKKDRAIFKELLTECKKYLHSITSHENDEWENVSFEENQRRPVSAH